MYHQTTATPSPLDLLNHLREQQYLMPRTTENQIVIAQANQRLRDTLRLFHASSCGCSAVRSHNHDFELTNIEIGSASYEYLLCKLDSIIESLEFITNQHDYYHHHHYRAVDICQAPSVFAFGRPILSNPTHQHQHQNQHQHQHPAQQQQHHQSQNGRHAMVGQQGFGFFNYGSGSNHTYPNDRPRGPNGHGHG